MATSAYVYKCVPAPRRAKRGRGHRTPADALVAAMEAALAEHAAAGWEYLRTDLVPMEARSGFFGATHETQQGVMVFRRPAAPDPAPDRRPDAEEALRRAPVLAPDRRRHVPERDEAGAGRPEIPRLGAARID